MVWRSARPPTRPGPCGHLRSAVQRDRPRPARTVKARRAGFRHRFPVRILQAADGHGAGFGHSRGRQPPSRQPRGHSAGSATREMRQGAARGATTAAPCQRTTPRGITSCSARLGLSPRPGTTTAAPSRATGCRRPSRHPPALVRTDRGRSPGASCQPAGRPAQWPRCPVPLRSGHRPHRGPIPRTGPATRNGPTALVAVGTPVTRRPPHRSPDAR